MSSQHTFLLIIGGLIAYNYLSRFILDCLLGKPEFQDYFPRTLVSFGVLAVVLLFIGGFYA